MEQEIQNLQMALQKLQADMQKMTQRLVAMEQANAVLSAKVFDFEVISTMRMGAGDVAFHADKEGFWWGKERISDILLTNPCEGTAVLMDGTFYAKGGVTGTIGSLSSASVVNGIITNIF